MRREALLVVVVCACWRAADRVETPPVVEKAVVAYRPPPDRDERPRPEEAQVGYWSGATFVPASAIALVPGTRYGWRIRLPCSAAVSFVETLALPGPTTWGHDPSTTINSDGSVAVTKTEASCSNDGWIEHVWVVNGDDPPGEYEVIVEIEGWRTVKLRTTFTAP